MRISDGDYTMLLSVSDKPGRGGGVGFTAPYRNPAPTCVLDPASGPETTTPAGTQTPHLDRSDVHHRHHPDDHHLRALNTKRAR